ncbi:MAG: prepilin-type N-terminal cleavage/methylation domain-containing protein [Verrucomicrobiota bacterium]|nr:prepilin-type N-terminal cleavage/methylation domain-containing protein [Verrucomicrobiota bacterium]
MRIRSHPQSAFTLVELLVASAITALIVVMLGTMFSSLTSTSLRANQRIDSFRDARAALQMIERDLSGLVRTQWTPNTTPVPITRPAAYLAMKNLYTDPGAANASTDNQQIYALIAAKNSGSGDVCSVGYYCRWNTSTNSYSLHRYFRDSTSTYNTINNSATYASETSLYTPDPQSTGPAAMRDEVLAAYVWGFRVTPYDAAGAVLPTPYPVCDSSATSNDPPPAAIEISFKAMSPNAARALISTGAQAAVWMTPSDAAYQRLIAPNAYEFRTRIKL